MNGKQILHLFSSCNGCFENEEFTHHLEKVVPFKETAATYVENPRIRLHLSVYCEHPALETSLAS